jgi:ribosomal protein S18 acetylase RimI-like enzyme
MGIVSQSASVGKQEQSGDTMDSVIEYCEDPTTLTPDQLRGGFFEAWPSPPSPELHLAHLRGAEVAVVALDDATGQVVGFVTAIGDGALTAFIPLLEVLPGYRGRGIGASLVRQVLARLRDRYSIDLVCDQGLIPFYERLGGVPGSAVLWRNRDALVTKTRT